ncbi:MAG: helix-turn-helix domain-containing protein [Chloroflexi bacterium]|nr:MAG: helix-turn-helix domain-containing protein [Chloroflexota bacterium]
MRARLADREAVSYSFGYWLRRRRKALDITQKRLAECAHCSVVTIKKIEADERRPSRQLATILADCLNIPHDKREQFVAMARGELFVDSFSLAQTPLTSRHNLPFIFSPFIGRTPERTAILNYLNHTSYRLINIIGMGGVGKTRLALEIARTQIGQYRDGVWFIPLEGITNAAVLPGSVAEALQLSFHGSDPPLTQISRQLRDQHMLLILDNFEQLVPEGLPFLTGLLQNCPDLQLLITSRERLNVRYETVIFLGALSRAEGVELFCQRMEQVNAQLSRTLEVEEAAARIWAAVGGLALGVELAAAWAYLLSPTEIAAELEQEPELLRATHRDVPARHQSIQVVLAASWQRLTPTEQTALMRLSLFRGGFTRQTARQAAQVSLSVLLRLMDRSLVVRENGRFYLHALTQRFAAEMLAQHPEEKLRTRQQFNAYFAHLLQQVEDEWLKFGHPRMESLTSVEVEMDNILAVWEWAITQADWSLLQQMSGGLTIFYAMRDRLHEGVAILNKPIEQLEQLATTSPTAETTLLLARLHSRRAEFAAWLGDLPAAEQQMAAVTAVFRQMEANVDLVYAQSWQGRLHYWRGNFDLAEKLVRESLALAQHYGFPGLAARAMDILANLLCEGSADYATAIPLYQECLAFYREVGNQYGEAQTLANLGAIYFEQGDYPTACRYWEQALPLCRQSNNQYVLAAVLTNLAMVTRKMGNLHRARQLLAEGLVLKRRMGNLYSLLHTLLEAGAIHKEMGDYEQAHTSYLEVLQQAVAGKMNTLAFHALLGIASVAIHTGNAEQATTWVAFVQAQPAAGEEAQKYARLLMNELEKKLPSQVLEQCCKQGQAIRLSDVLATLLN